jgi:heat shock protein HslJ
MLRQGDAMHRSFPSTLAFAPALLLAACATVPLASPVTPDTSADSYFALGTEPFWNVEITPMRLTFHDAERRTVRVANPGARPSFNGERYVTPQLTVDITHSPCSDGMSDRRYRDSVMVEVNGRSWRGCGGPRLAAATLEGTNWRIVSLGGIVPRGDRPAELRFAEGRLNGSIGCNRLSATVASDGARVNVGAVAATRMACAPEVMAQETQLFALLRRSLSVRAAEDGTMLLSDGTTALVLARLR